MASVVARSVAELSHALEGPGDFSGKPSTSNFAEMGFLRGGARRSRQRAIVA